MIRATAILRFSFFSLFLLPLLPACADTESQRAFTPRPAAVALPRVTTPNTSAQREHELADCFERSLDAQEQEDRDERDQSLVPPLPTLMPEGTPRPPRRHHTSDRSPVASFQ
jgi:hypothetical protein